MCVGIRLRPECHAIAHLGAIHAQRAVIVEHQSVEAQRAAGIPRKLVGLILEDRGVLRGHQKVIAPGAGEGELTSGTFSPTLERSIGFARVPA